MVQRPLAEMAGLWDRLATTRSRSSATRSIATKKASNRPKDRETLPRLEDFQRYLQQRGMPGAHRLPRLPDEMQQHPARGGYTR